MSKLVKNTVEITPTVAFVDAIERSIEADELGIPALERCPACGSDKMRDAQAQFVGACSPGCAKALGVSGAVMKMSGSMPPEQLANIGPHDLCARCKHTRENHCLMHAESHCLMADCEYKCKSFENPCTKCGGCGSVSVPGELADATCNACKGTGINDLTSEDLWGSGMLPVVIRQPFVECGVESPVAMTDGRRAKCRRLINHEGSHGGNVIGVDGIITWGYDER